MPRSMTSWWWRCPTTSTWTGQPSARCRGTGVVDKPLAPTAAELGRWWSGRRDWGPDHGVHESPLGLDQLTLRPAGRGSWASAAPQSSWSAGAPLSPAEPWREVSAPQAGGGVLLDLGTHLADQALVLFGPVVHVYAEVESRRGGVADDDVFLALEHRSGARSHLWASLVAAAPGPRLRVLGDRAGYIVTDVDGQEDALRAGARPGGDEEWGVEPPERWGRLIVEERSEAVASERGNWPRFYTDLERALREGSPPPVDPGTRLPASRCSTPLGAARRRPQWKPSSRVRARRARVWLHQLGDQRGPAELPRSETLAGVGLVELAQALADDGLGETLRHLERLGFVALAEQADPNQPRRVDPGRPAPVEPAQRALPSARLKAGLLRGDGRGRVGQPVLARVEEVLLDQALADLLRQIRERQWRQSGPGGDTDAMVAPGRIGVIDLRDLPRAVSRKSPRRSSQRRSISAGVIEGSPAAIRARHQRTLVTTSQRTGPPAASTRRASQSTLRFLSIRSGNMGCPCAWRPQTGRTSVRNPDPDSSGWTIQSRPSPSRSRLASSQR